MKKEFHPAFLIVMALLLVAMVDFLGSCADKHLNTYGGWQQGKDIAVGTAISKHHKVYRMQMVDGFIYQVEDKEIVWEK